MSLRLPSVWLVPLVTLLGVGSAAAKASAQTTYPFETSYNTEVTLIPIQGSDVSQAFVYGFNANAPYGLTNFESINNYSRQDPNTGNLVFVQDPTQFGLQGFPFGSEQFYGSGNDKLFSTSTATASFDFPNNLLSGTGTVTITGGSGRFSGATGTLSFTETESLDQPPNAPLKGQAVFSGSFQVPQKVPESRTSMALLGVGVIGAGFLRSQRRRYQLEKQ